MDKSKREKELKELSRMITEALTHSEEVMAYLADLKKRNIIDSSTLLGLALKVNDLLVISSHAYPQQAEEQEAERTRAMAAHKEQNAASAEPAPAQREQIDGRELSSAEIAFEEWSRKKFSQNTWLRDVGLIW